MTNESLLKAGLIVVIFLSMLFYHITNLISVSDANVFTIVKIVQFVVLAIFIAFSVFTQIVPKLIPWETFIGGKYAGKSFEFKIQPGTNNNDQHIEYFSIKQTLFETTINGVSKRDGDKDNYSTWFGRRFHVHGDTHYFGLIITTPNRSSSGVLQLTLSDGKVTGFYFSGNPDSTKQCCLSACRVVSFSKK